MSVRYQWVKFQEGADLQSSDYGSGEWVLVEIDDDWPDAGVSLFGVEYTVPEDQIEEWGPEVSRPLLSAQSR